MPSGLFKDARVRFGLAGLALGASAPLLDALLQYLIFHSHSSFLEYLRYLSHQPEVLATHAFYVAGVAVMGAAGVLVGALRQSDAEHKAMLEAKNAELHKSREELKKLSEGLEEKVKDGQEEIIEVARRLKEANAKLLRLVDSATGDGNFQASYDRRDKRRLRRHQHPRNDHALQVRRFDRAGDRSSG